MQSYRLLDETEQRFHQNFLHRNGNTGDFVADCARLCQCPSGEEGV